MQNMGSMSDSEQLDVVNNLIAAFRADKASLQTLLDVSSLSVESDYWDVIIAPLNILGTIRHALLNDQYPPEYRALINRLYAPHFKALGFAPDTAADNSNPTATARLRQQVITAMAMSARDPAIRGQLAAMAKNYLGENNDSINKEAISPDLVNLALAVTVEDSDTSFARQLLDRGLSSTDTIFRRDVFSALAHTRDIDFGKSLIDAQLLSDRIRSNEAVDLIDWFMANPDYREYTWTWLMNNFDAFLKRYSSFSAEWIVSLGEYFCDEEARDGMQAFYRGVQDKVPGAPRRITEIVETVNQCIAIKAAYSDDWKKAMVARARQD
jgi:alanyl aminopeptidase